MKLKIYLLIAILLISTASGYLLVSKQDECINLLQTCATCTYNNITSISFPNSTITAQEIAMTKVGIRYNYTFCTTSSLGEYQVNGHGDLEGNTTIWRYAFKITPNGEDPTTATVFFYIGLMILFICLLTAMIYGLTKTPHIWGKYAYIAGIYLLLIGLTFIGWKMALDYITSNTFIAGFLFIIFIILTIAFFPFVLVSFIYLLFQIARIKEIERLMEKGIPYNEALQRSKK